MRRIVECLFELFFSITIHDIFLLKLLNAEFPPIQLTIVQDKVRASQ
jgi:hypothetical protein